MPVYSSILAPYHLRDKSAPNRLAAQSMEINSSGPSGSVSDAIIDRYRRLAEGRWGIVFVEAISVTPDSQARTHSLVLNKGTVKGFKKLVESFKSINPDAIIMFQLTHPGRLGGGFSRKVKVYGDDDQSHLLTEMEAGMLVEAFLEAVRLSAAAGADGVDIKACHGYLGGEFLRPLNRRDDRYGGSAENRARFVSSILLQARREFPRFILGTRVSLYEGIRGGCGTASPDEVIEDLNDIIDTLGHLAGSGADFFNVSAGIPRVTPQITRPQAGSLPSLYHHFRYAKTVRRAFPGIAVIGSAYSSGREEGLPFAEENIARGYADFAGFGRQNLADPLFPKKMLYGGGGADICILCGGCSLLLKEQKQVRCVKYDQRGAGL